MTHLLLITFPLLMGVALFVLRAQTRLTLAVGGATCLVGVVLAAQVPTDRIVRVLGLVLVADPLSRLVLVLLFGVAALVCIASWWLPHGENFVPIALLTLSFATAALYTQQEPFTSTLLLVSGGLLAVLALIDLPSGSQRLVERSSIAAALKYLVLVVIAGVALFLAFVLAELYQPGLMPDRASPARLTLALLTVGFGVRLALAPFHGWLADFADAAFPVVAALMLTVINSVSVLLLVSALQSFPAIVFDNDRGFEILMGYGVFSALFGGLLALLSTTPQRVVAHLLVFGAGISVFGVATTSVDGLSAAVLAVLTQILAIPLVFLSIAGLESGWATAAELPRSRVVPLFGLTCGALMLVGVPPLASTVSRARLFAAAAEQGSGYALLLLLATLLALAGVVRLTHRSWAVLQAEQATAAAAPRAAMRGPTLVLVLLVALALSVSLRPEQLEALVADAVRALTFVSGS